MSRPPAFSRRVALSALVIAAGPAWLLAAPTVFTDTPIRTGLLDTSTVGFAETKSQAYFGNSDPLDGNLFINSVNFVPGANFNPLITFEAPSALNYTGSNQTPFFGTYNYGTPIASEDFYFFNTLYSHFGAIDPNVPVGIYDYSVQFVGGNSADAADVMGTINYQIEVFTRLDLTVTGFASPAAVGAGESAVVTMTVRNDMTDRNFVTTTWYQELPAFTDGTNTLGFGEFIGDWFSKSIVPGGSRTDDHTRFTILPTDAPGNYIGGLGVFGGLHNGDEFAFGFRPTLTVIPEPAALGLAAPLALLMLRRRA